MSNSFSERPSRGIVIFGTLIDTPSSRTLRVRKNHYCIVSGTTGKLTHIGSYVPSQFEDDPVRILGEDKFRECDVIWLQSTQFLCPGMIDTHIHAPQYRQLGSANNLQLLQWLDEVTFPNEAKCKEPEYARMLYTRLVQRMLRNGTTTAQYFATIHLEASKILADICNNFGQRAYVGKVNMDKLSPDYYIEETQASLRDTETFIQYCRAKFVPSPDRAYTIHPVVTPRFIPTCSHELLKGLGTLAEKYDCHIQSHAAETVDQLSLVRKMYPDLERDAKIFQSVGLFRPSKTLFAHCVYLRNSEVDLFAANEIGIAACPYANQLHSRNVVPVERYMKRGLRVGLGTDVAGGSNLSMLSAVRLAILAERTVEFTNIDRDSEDWWPENTKPNWAIDYIWGYYLATVGSARALGLEDVLGKLEVGYEFDALQVECPYGDDDGPFDFYTQDETHVLFEKWINQGDDRNIKRVWVQGKDVTIHTYHSP